MQFIGDRFCRIFIVARYHDDFYSLAHQFLNSIGACCFYFIRNRHKTKGFSINRNIGNCFPQFLFGHNFVFQIIGNSCIHLFHQLYIPQSHFFIGYRSNDTFAGNSFKILHFHQGNSCGFGIIDHGLRQWMFAVLIQRSDVLQQIIGFIIRRK